MSARHGWLNEQHPELIQSRPVKRARGARRYGEPHGGPYGMPRTVGGATTFNGRVLILGDSNGVGASNFNATGQSDTGYGVVDINGSGFAACQINAQWAQAIFNPVSWLTMSGDLRAYDIAGNLNCGHEQTLGRRLVELGLHASPKISKFALSGTTQHTHWRTDSTFPNNPSNLNSQAVQYAQARETALGGAHDVIVVVLGENDCGSSTNANPTQADLTNIIGGIRTGLGRPNQLVYLVVINAATTGAFASTVIAGQLAYVASDPNCRAIRVDDIPLPANPHYGFNGYATIGDRIVRQIQRDFFADAPVNRSPITTTPIWADYGSCVTTAAAASGSPRAGSEERDGDFQLLVVTGQSAAATHSLSVAAGFTLLGSFESVFGGTNHRSMALWWRLVTQSVLDANGGMMPTPTFSAGAVQTSLGVIHTFRGATKFVGNPIDIFASGANNANSTALSIPGGTTTTPNQLGIIVTSNPSNTTTVTSATNSNIPGLTKKRESVVTSASFIGYSIWVGPIPTQGTVVPPTAVVMSGVGVNVGAFVSLKNAA